MTSNGTSSTTKRATADLKKRPYAKAVAWFADWIVADKRRRHPRELYAVGIQGSIGRGKSVFSRKLVDALNARLLSTEGRALTCSLDDYYLPKRIRYQSKFLARGYDPSGISNRGPAGTHDLPLLIKNLKAMEKSSKKTSLRLSVFDKQADDRAREERVFHGRVGVFILEGWFVGAAAPSRIKRFPSGVAGSAARALAAYQPVFNRLDALWVFETPSFSTIVKERVGQQKTLDRRSGHRGMTPVQIRRFVTYFYKEAWIPGVTSPVPPAPRITFRAAMDARRRWIKITPGLKFKA